ncbi:alpha-1,3-mannosyl-glycoprotein 4-beta-N-acetylglucosaminyltransferase-like protein MGAT4D isoform X2 [Tachyglossus aculeatus]|uniref:alpha-1,3-mannosyl-glycoprotein 4-beta-N-acetylglucosaminyltransferase-like protein MGAT4D isoform X2 n=1 Tax=Tachyglossus aculeatus TaxID=9261 RepID=UPI0018F5ACCA|nr:alpha-1,3-mannosyl-glycoprotein 4-beta-N-acetylglucosaminyltransferase-like protein MGAT4D isoform X2 [Tachyglossus aculeatus]
MRFRNANVLAALGLCALFSFSWLSSHRTNGRDDLKWKILDCSKKLPVHLSNMYYYLPHLQEHEDSVYPNVITGQRRTGVSLVMGIPTVKRQRQNYLIETLKSLFYEMSAAEKDDCVVVIFIAEVDEEYINSVAESVKNNFPSEVQSGVLEIVSPPASYYPVFSDLKETFGDSKERVRWRTKQNLDYSFLMLYAQPKGTFYLQLEDDIVAKPQYFQTIKNFATQQTSDEWIILEFSQLGFIGKLFRSRDLPFIVEFFLMFYKDKPIDWLLDHLLWVRVCNPEKDARHCDRQKTNLRIRYKPSLFQHVGTYSSLPGKIQNLKDKDFGKSPLHVAHVNPPAYLITSLKEYQHYSLEKAYLGAECFWAYSPVAGDYILINFKEPLQMKGYLFRSGNAEHPGDKLFNTTVEILPAEKADLLKISLENGDKFDNEATENEYFKIGAFENGIAEGTVSPTVGKIKALRLTVLSNSPVWALLSEIFIRTG